MPYALTNGPCLLVSFAADTRALLRDGIRDALLATNWALDSTVTGGYVMLGTSPQGFSVRLKIWDNGRTSNWGTQQLSLQFTSASGSSLERRLAVATGYTYQVWSNMCQVFISRPGVREDQDGSVVCGGVPWVPPAICHGATVADTVTEVWWSMGDQYGNGVVSGQPVSPSATFRSRLLQFNTYGYSGPSIFVFEGIANDAMWNGSYCESVQGHKDASGATVWDGALELCTLQEGDNGQDYWYGSGSFDSQTLLAQGITVDGLDTNVPLVYDPLLAWGDTISDLAQIKAQIWDAGIVSRHKPMDLGDYYERVITSPPGATYHWVNFTDMYPWGALWLLLKTAGGAPGNVAF